MESKEVGRRRRRRVSGVVTVAVVAGTIAYKTVPAAGWTTNDVTTGQSSAYPALRPRVYDMPPDQTLQVAAAVAARQPGWTIVRTDRHAGEMFAEAPSLLGLRTDIVTVTVIPYGRNARVFIRSRSRVRGGDFGANAAHIQALQAAMDERLNQIIY